MVPALLIRTSIGPCHDDAKPRTDDRELTRSRTSVSPAIPSATACPLAWLRTFSTTWAPARATASAVALPSQLVAPVTMIVLPVKSGRSAAVQFVTVMRDSLRRFGYASGGRGTVAPPPRWTAPGLRRLGRGETLDTCRRCARSRPVAPGG